MIRKRRLSTTSKERAEISKQIQKVSRGNLRKHQNEEATKMLQQFSGLSDLPKHQEYPIKKSRNSAEIDCNIFAEALQEIYEDNENTLLVYYEKSKIFQRLVYLNSPTLYGKCAIVVGQINRISSLK